MTPAWLLDLAESLAGLRRDGERVIYPSLDELFLLKQRALESAEADPYSVWARGFFTE